MHLNTVKPSEMLITEMCKQKASLKANQPPFSPSWTWSLTGINVLQNKNWKSSCLEEPGSQSRAVTRKSSSNTLYLISLYHWWGFFACFNHLCLAQSSLLSMRLPHSFVFGKRCLSSALAWGAGDGACAAHLDLLTGFKLSVCNQSVLQTQFSSYLPFKQLT